MKIAVGSKNPVKIEAVKRVFTQVFPDQQIEIFSYAVPSGVPPQPFDAQVAQGAASRAQNALRDCDYGVGIEAGLIWNGALENFLDVQFCAIIDSQKRITLGHGPGFLYPPEVIRSAQSGQTISQAMSKMSGIEDIGQQMGAIGFLSKNLLDRTQLTEQAVLMALIPRIRPDLYFSNETLKKSQ